MSKNRKTSPEFRKKLEKAIRVLVRETHDGCVDCQVVSRKAKSKQWCDKHTAFAYEVLCNPRKYIKL